MVKLSAKLNSEGYTLRSGGADGADLAFEQPSTNKEIYLPWKNFNNNRSYLYDIAPEAFVLASQFHPVWDKLSPAVRKLMARNIHQITGQDLNTPSSFVVCYTPQGKLTGGTRQAIEYAMSLGIEVINLGNQESLDRINKYIKAPNETT